MTIKTITIRYRKYVHAIKHTIMDTKRDAKLASCQNDTKKTPTIIEQVVYSNKDH